LTYLFYLLSRAYPIQVNRLGQVVDIAVRQAAHIATTCGGTGLRTATGATPAPFVTN